MELDFVATAHKQELYMRTHPRDSLSVESTVPTTSAVAVRRNSPLESKAMARTGLPDSGLVEPISSKRSMS